MQHKSISQIHTTCDQVKERLDHYILSASGLRAVFASTGNEEDSIRTICDEDKVIVVTIARAFNEFIKEKNKRVISKITRCNLFCSFSSWGRCCKY